MRQRIERPAVRFSAGGLVTGGPMIVIVDWPDGARSICPVTRHRGHYDRRLSDHWRP